MNLGETAKLIIQLDLKGNAAAGIKNVTQKLGDLNKATSGKLGQGFKTLGTGLGVAFLNGAKIAIGAIGGIVGAIAVMAKEGQEAQKVQLILDQAIKNSGKVSTDYVKILKDQSLALMNLSGMNDEAIKSAQTMLIQMGLTGKQVADTTPLVLDFAEATGLDLQTAAKLTGKSINGMSGALARYGVFVDKAKFKTDPYVATMEALNKKFGGTTKALSGTLEARLGAFREGLANIREEAGIKLLPALTRIVDIAGRKLVPAFAKFIDRILPSLIRGINQFADLLEGGGVEKGLNAITDAIGPMVKVLQMAVGPVKAIVATFLKLPQKVQAALISGVILNKLSGGLVAQGGKDIIGGVGSIAGPSLGAAFGALLQKVGFTKGATPANPLFVMDVQNRLANGQFAAGTTSKLTGLGSALQKVFIVGEAIGLAALVLDVRNGIVDSINAQSTGLEEQTKAFIATQPKKDALLNALRGVNQGITDIKSNPLNVLVQGDALTKLQGIQATLMAQLGRLDDIANSIGGILFNPNRPSRPSKDDIVRGPSVQDTQSHREFASGEYDVPYDMPAKVHKGEMILPSRLAKMIRNHPNFIDRENARALKDEDEYVRTVVRREDLFNKKERDVRAAVLPPQGPHRREIENYRAMRDEDAYVRTVVRREELFEKKERPIQAHVNVSTRDVNTSQNLKRRYGPTYTQAGAG